MADATVTAPVVFKKRAARGNIKKRAATPPSASSESDYSSGGGGEDEPGTNTRIKRRRKGGLQTSVSTSSKPSSSSSHTNLAKNTQYVGDRSATITNLDDATKTSNWSHVDETTTAQQGEDAEGEEKNGNYKGAKGYGNFIKKNPEKVNKTVGPTKAPTNMRMITLVDFAPDVCKDYKQTGFVSFFPPPSPSLLIAFVDNIFKQCGFGDSCKFLHAREDYKQGWQLDKEWEKADKSKPTKMASANRQTENSNNAANDDSENDQEAKDLEKIPFACIICKEAYKNPVVTKCGHYFCEICALKRHKSKGGKTCANCGADTGGTFNVAKNLRKLLDRKRERIRRRKEKARENGDEVSSDDDDNGEQA
jgi:RING finger protein 113A